MHRTPEQRRPSAEELLREFGELARLVVYIAAAPGAGKTRRLLTDARRLQAAGKRVAIGWVETKGRPDLEHLTDEVPMLPPRIVMIGDTAFPEFDLEGAIAARPEVIVLDELAHENLPGSVNAKRWQDALALKAAGISVLGAFNIAHLETVAAVAESLIGYPVREIVPLSFLKSADEVIALDISPELLRQRLASGKIVRDDDDIDRALGGVYSERTLTFLRELLLRTIDGLTIPTVSAASTSAALAIVLAGADPTIFLRRTMAITSSLDLNVVIAPAPRTDSELLAKLARELDAELLPEADPAQIAVTEMAVSLVAVPNGKLARKLCDARLNRDLIVIDAQQSYLAEASLTTPLSGTIGDRMREGYGKLVVYLGAAAGAGKTMAMLDRGHQLKADGIDVVIGLVETHGRKDTEAMCEGLEIVPRVTTAQDGINYHEFDREAIIARHPQVALIDELAHTNAPGSLAAKRYLDVLAVLRAGIDVMTTLNVQHLEELVDVVQRLTGMTVRETLPAGILPLADEVILVDVTPETLRERLRSGKIYPPERIDAALKNFFRTENLAALRELAIREALRAEMRERIAAPFERLLLSVVARPEDIPLLRRAGRLAARLEVDFTICHVAGTRDKVDPKAVAELERIARSGNAEFIDERAEDPAERLIELARSRPETNVAIGAPLRPKSWLRRTSFACRLLDAGARELIVLTRPVSEQLAPEEEYERK